MDQQPQETPKKKDETINGFLIIAGILVIVIGFIFLLSRQQKGAECVPTYNPDGTVQTGCGAATIQISPTPETSVDLLDQLNEGQVSEVDKRLQEAAQDLRNRQNAQQQQRQQQQLPPMPQ